MARRKTSSRADRVRKAAAGPARSVPLKPGLETIPPVLMTGKTELYRLQRARLQIVQQLPADDNSLHI